MSSSICTICKDLLMEPKKRGSWGKGLEERDWDPVVGFCGHLSHNHCLQKWMDFQKDNKMPLACFYCFKDIRKIDFVKIYPSEDTPENYHTLKKRVEKHNQVKEAMSAELANAMRELSLTKETMEAMDTIDEEHDIVIEELRNGILGKIRASKQFREVDRVLLQYEIKCLKAQCEELDEQIQGKTIGANSTEAALKSVSHTVETVESKGSSSKRKSLDPKKVLGKIKPILGYVSRSLHKGEEKH